MQRIASVGSQASPLEAEVATPVRQPRIPYGYNAPQISDSEPH